MDEPTKVIPPERIARLERFAELMDSQFPIPFTPFRIGVDGILGLVPGVGDAASAALGVYLLGEAVSLQVRKRTIVRMVINTGADAVLGSVPLIGDLFDFAFKSNAMNARLILRDIEKRQWRWKGRVIDVTAERKG